MEKDLKKISAIWKRELPKLRSVFNVATLEIFGSFNPAVRDVRNLRDFAQKMEKPVKAFLIYKGEKYKTIDNVQLIPAAALFRAM